MNLEILKKELELRKVETARYELEFRAAERLEEIERITLNIEIQSKKEEELKKELIALKEGK